MARHSQYPIPIPRRSLLQLTRAPAADINMEAVVAESQRVQAMTPRSVLYREHAPPSERHRSGQLDGPPLPLAELRQMRLPRLAADELLEWSRRPGPSQVCVIDVRPAEEYPFYMSISGVRRFNQG